MKKCPQCGSYYADDTLDFCTEDGTRLTAANPSEEATRIISHADSEETRLRPRRVTPLPTAPAGNTTAGQNAAETNRAQNNQYQGQFAPPPAEARPAYLPAAVAPAKRSSRLPILIFSAFGVLLLVGVATVVWYGASRGWVIGGADDNSNRRSRNINQTVNRNVNRAGANSNLGINRNSNEGANTSSANTNSEPVVVNDNTGGGQVEEDESEAAVLNKLMSLEGLRMRAIISGNRATLDGLLAENYVGTIDGEVQTKEQYLDSLQADATINSWEFTGAQLYLAGDTAVVTGRLRLGYKDGSEPETFNFTDSFIRSDGRWQIVTSQVTEE